MRIINFLVAVSFVTSQSIFAADAKPAPAFMPVSQGVKVFNMIQGASRLFLAMKVGASADDEQFLDSLAEKFKAEHLPRATAKGDSIWLQGLDKPFKVVDLRKGLFSYGGQNFDVNMKDGLEKGLDDLDKLVFPKAALWISWVLPEAHANIDPMVLLASMVGVGGLAVAANSCGDGPNNSTIGCGMGGLMGGFGLGYLIASLLDDKKPPQNMTCYPGQNGCSQVVLMGPNRVPVNTISQCPGQAYSYSPALAQVPPAQSQYMASQLSSMCPYPGMMTNLNAAYSSPTLIPLQQTAAVRPLTAPGILPFAAPRPLVPSALKPAAVRPAIAPAQMQTPADPAGAIK